MEVIRTLARLQSIADRFLEWQTPRFAAPAASEAIHELERVAGTRLPGDLRAFLERLDEIVAMDIHNGYWLGGTGALTRSVLRNDFPKELKTGGSLIQALPVATDGGGNAFLVASDGGGVWRWDHETRNTAQVATSFSKFLARVADDWEHAAADDPDWAFLV